MQINGSIVPSTKKRTPAWPNKEGVYLTKVATTLNAGAPGLYSQHALTDVDTYKLPEPSLYRTELGVQDLFMCCWEVTIVNPSDNYDDLQKGAQPFE